MKKKQTRMAAGLAAALMLTAQGASAQSHLEQEEMPNKPGFFRQLGTSLKNAGQEMVGVKPAQGGAKSTGGGEAIYAPAGGPGKIAGLFKSDNHQQAQLGKLEWPRVALTFQEWGASLPCWTVEAKIWTSASASTTETFRTCAGAALTETDDLGDTAELNTSALWNARDTLMGVRVAPSKPNTGSSRSPVPTRPASRSSSTSPALACQKKPSRSRCAWRGSRASSKPPTSTLALLGS